MKTNNLAIELMIPSQLNKDIVFNESILKIDSFINISVNGFVDKIPDNIKTGEKYIITKGANENKICYKPLISKPELLLEPANNMIVFDISDSNFFIFTNNNWQKITHSFSVNNNVNTTIKLEKKFTSVSGDITITDNNWQYLYLDSDTNLNLSETETYHSEINIIIKQSNNSINKITWPSSILWEYNRTHNITQKCNSIDLIKLFKLPESNHFLGKIIAQDFNY